VDKFDSLELPLDSDRDSRFVLKGEPLRPIDRPAEAVGGKLDGAR
jgi:hypothetical protein